MAPCTTNYAKLLAILNNADNQWVQWPTLLKCCENFLSHTHLGTDEEREIITQRADDLREKIARIQTQNETDRIL